MKFNRFKWNTHRFDIPSFYQRVVLGDYIWDINWNWVEIGRLQAFIAYNRCFRASINHFCRLVVFVRRKRPCIFSGMAVSLSKVCIHQNSILLSDFQKKKYANSSTWIWQEWVNYKFSHFYDWQDDWYIKRITVR